MILEQSLTARSSQVKSKSDLEKNHIALLHRRHLCVQVGSSSPVHSTKIGQILVAKTTEDALHSAAPRADPRRPAANLSNPAPETYIPNCPG